MSEDIIKQNDDSPEHISPLGYYDPLFSKEKEEARKLAKRLKDSGKIPEPIIITEKGGVKKASELNGEEIEQEFLKCAIDPVYFIETYLTIFDQTKGNGGEIVPFILFEIQKDLIDDYLNNRFVVANKYRQAGISTTTCAYIAWYIMFQKNRSVAIIADKLETARDELMNDVVEFINSCPDWLKPKTATKDTQKLKRYDNGCQLSAFSSKGLRGYTPTLLFWDETAWTEKSDKFWTSAGPTLQTGGRAIFVSCVTKDSYIYTNNGIKQIKDFIVSDELGPHYINDSYIGGVNKTRKTNIILNNGYVDTLKIKTRYNELESSENHKYWVYKNNKYSWIKAKDLKVGDYISLQKGCEIWGNNDDCIDFNPTKNKKIKHVFNPSKITNDIAYLIGLFISKGYVIKKNKNNSNEKFIITCGDDISTIFNKLNISFTCDDGIHYVVSSKNVIEFFEYLGFDLEKWSPQKTIPSRILEMSRNNIISLMQGIMDGDGWASYDEKHYKIRIGIDSSSIELIKQIRIILANFGIFTEFGEFTSKPTKKAKVESTQYRLTINDFDTNTYFKKIGFRLKRKQCIGKLFDMKNVKHKAVHDNIPNGSDILKEIYNIVKYYGIHNDLKKHNINIKDVIQKNKNTIPVLRKTILGFIVILKNKIPQNIIEKYENIISENIVWVQIKEITKSKNWTYDFSMSNDNPKESDEFHMQITYNQIITHQTPNGLDSTFYKTFDGAIKGTNNFKPVELWWYNDPRYNKDLEWIKNKGKENEIRIKDGNWTKKYRKKLHDEGWKATSPWFEEQVLQANGDMRKIAQEILCSFLGSGDNFIAEEYLQRIEEKEIKPPIKQEYVDLNFWIWEDPQPGEEYIMPIDVAAGHGEDNSTINILKVNTIIEEKVITKNGVSKKYKVKRQKTEQVAEYYGKVTPQMLAEIAYQFGKRYNDALAVIDITGGYGVQTIEKLLEFSYSNIHYSEVTHKPSRDRLQGYIKKGQKLLSDGKIIEVDLIPGFFIGNNRASVLLEMQRAIHLSDVIIRSIRLSSELKTFVNVPGNRVADHKRSFHDDSIMGLAIGLFVLNFDLDRFKYDRSNAKKLLDIMININDPTKIQDRLDNERANKENRIKQNMRTNPNFKNFVINDWLFKNLK